jgi:hypothetical protein
VPVQELDLTSELGQVEAVSRGLNSPTFPALDELPEPHERSAEPTLESFALPTIAPARAPTERALSAEQVNSAVEAALSLLEKRIGEIVPLQFGQFEQKLEVLAQQSVSLVQARLQESVADLEPTIADLLENKTASLRDRLQGAHVEVEGLMTRLEELREQVHTSLPASVAREEEEYASELELRMEATLARHLAAAEDRLQDSRAAVEGLLRQVDGLRQKTQGNLQGAPQTTQESSAELEQRLIAAVEQQLASVGRRLQDSQADVEGLLARLEEQRQQAQASLQEVASRLEGESAARLEQRITATLDQQLASVADRLKGSNADSNAEAEGLLARLVEQRQQAQANLQEVASRLEGESAGRLEQRITAALDQQLASDRLQGPRAEVDGWLGRLEEARQQAHRSLQDAAAAREADSGARLEQTINPALESQLASAAERLQEARASVESLLAHVEEIGRQVQGTLLGSVAQIEEKVTSSLQQHLTAVDERLQSERREAESLRVELEQAGQEAQSRLQESAAQMEQESAARLEERMRLSFDQQMASILDRVQSSRVEIEASLSQLQETQRELHTSLEESATRQKLLIDDTTKAFRQKVGEILVMLQHGSGESR